MFGHSRMSAERAMDGSAAALAMVLLMAPLRLAAQDVGDRVRIALSDTIVVGEVAAIDPQSIDLVLEDGRNLSVDWSKMFRLEQGLAKKWTWIGGAWLGFAAGCSLIDCLEDRTIWGSKDALIPAVGAVAGLAVMALSGIDTWQGIDLPDQPPSPIVGERIRVALADATIAGDVTRVDRQGFDVAVQDGRIVSVDRSEIFRLEQDVAAGETYWAEGLVLGGIVGSAILLYRMLEFSAGFLSFYDEVATSELVLTTVGPPAIGLGIGAMLDKSEAWEVIEAQRRVARFTPMIDFGFDHLGEPVVLLGGRIRH